MKGAIFDVDGTLLDSMFIWEGLGERYLSSLHLKAHSDLRGKLATMSMTEAAFYLKQTYHIEKSESEIIAGVNRILESFYFEEVELKTGVKSFLKLLNEKNVKMTVATASDRYLIEAAFKRLEIGEYFQRIFTCSEVGTGKSEAKIFMQASTFMHTVPAETWVFDDALYALDTAAKAGYKTAGVYDTLSVGDKEKIEQNTDIYLYELKDCMEFWGE